MKNQDLVESIFATNSLEDAKKKLAALLDILDREISDLEAAVEWDEAQRRELDAGSDWL